MARGAFKRTTDFGTIILHCLLVITLVVSIATGLRIAVDAPDAGLPLALGAILPSDNVWFLHIMAGVGVMIIAAAYAIYMRASGKMQRIKLDSLRLKSASPWPAVNVILYWLLFALLAMQIVTGVLLHRGFGGAVVQLHLFATWIIILYAFAHVSAHFAEGGAAQLMRVLRPGSITAPSSPGVPHALKIAAGTILAGVIVAVAWFETDRFSRDVLVIGRVVTAPQVSGDLTDPAWRTAQALVVRTQQGANLDETGESTVEIRAVHDGVDVYFAFTWQDSTRSTKHFPLVKGQDGWRVLMYERQTAQAAQAALNTSRRESPNFEGAYAEDKFSVMLAPQAKPFGPGAFHPGTKPLADKPASSSGRGLHYTTDGSSVDAWVWHASTSMLNSRCEVSHIGAPSQPTDAQKAGREIYAGGISMEADQRVVTSNYRNGAGISGAQVSPFRLPLDVSAFKMLSRQMNLDSDQSDPESARWFMSDQESAPYSPAQDALFPVGSIIPGLVTLPERNPGPADVMCAARWAAGRWTLIARRKLETGRTSDVSIKKGAHMFVAVFDHTVARHTRHIRPIRLAVKL